MPRAPQSATERHRPAIRTTRWYSPRSRGRPPTSSLEHSTQNFMTATKLRDWVKARRKAFRDGIASGVSRSGPTGTQPLNAERTREPTAPTGHPMLGQVEVAEAPCVYSSMEIHATKLRLAEIASSSAKVVLRLGVTF